MQQSNLSNHDYTVGRQLAGVFILLIAITALLGCAEEKTITPAPQTTYYTDIKYIFDIKCATSGCPAGNEPAAALGMETYDEIMAGSIHGSVITPKDAQSSLLYRTMAGTSPPLMPPEGKLPQSLNDSVAKWINDGAFETQ